MGLDNISVNEFSASGSQVRSFTGITFIQLKDDGLFSWNKYQDFSSYFDWDSKLFSWSDFRELFDAQYDFREISIEPFGKWVRLFKNQLVRSCRRYSPIFHCLGDDIPIFQDSFEYKKNNRVNSTYPVTIIDDTQNFASNSEIEEYELHGEGNYLDKIDQYMQQTPLQVGFIDEFDHLFTHFLGAL